MFLPPPADGICPAPTPAALWRQPGPQRPPWTETALNKAQPGCRLLLSRTPVAWDRTPVAAAVTGLDERRCLPPAANSGCRLPVPAPVSLPLVRSGPESRTAFQKAAWPRAPAAHREPRLLFVSAIAPLRVGALHRPGKTPRPFGLVHRARALTL